MPLDTAFRGIEAAKPSRAADYFRQGHYIYRIDRIKFDINRKSEEFVAVECTCIHALNDNNGLGHRVGDTPTNMLMLKWDMFFPNFKAMVLGLIKCEDKEVTEEACKMICDPTAQPFQGMLIETINKDIVTKEEKDFTQVDFKRQIPAAEVAALISEVTKQQLFPQGELDAKVNVEKTKPVPQ